MTSDLTALSETLRRAGAVDFDRLVDCYGRSAYSVDRLIHGIAYASGVEGALGKIEDAFMRVRGLEPLSLVASTVSAIVADESALPKLSSLNELPGLFALAADSLMEPVKVPNIFMAREAVLRRGCGACIAKDIERGEVVVLRLLSGQQTSEPGQLVTGMFEQKVRTCAVLAHGYRGENPPPSDRAVLKEAKRQLAIFDR